MKHVIQFGNSTAISTSRGDTEDGGACVPFVNVQFVNVQFVPEPGSIVLVAEGLVSGLSVERHGRIGLRSDPSHVQPCMHFLT